MAYSNPKWGNPNHLLGLWPSTKGFKAQENPHKEKQVEIVVKPDHDRVKLEFGTPVTWIGLNPVQAREVAHALLQFAQDTDPD